jgi:hypothetical protein
MVFTQSMDVEYPIFNRASYAVDQDHSGFPIAHSPKTRVDTTDFDVLILRCLS